MSGSAGVPLATAALPRFKRDRFFGANSQDEITRFVSLFHRYGYILKSIHGGSWFSAHSNFFLDDSQILKAVACENKKYFVGTRCGKATRYAVLDIDVGSRYHNKTALDKLRKALADAGITKTTLFRSSYSDGWHLYIFFDELISSRDLRHTLVQLLKLNGFDINKGTLEVFPHPGFNTDGQGLRLPLQPGFAWLDPNDLEVLHDRMEISAQRALIWFLDLVENHAHTRHEFHFFKAYVERLAREHARTIASVGDLECPGTANANDSKDLAFQAPR